MLVPRGEGTVLSGEAGSSWGPGKKSCRALLWALRGYEPMVSKSDMDTFVLERYPPF